jgi:hypothetical protein
MDPGSGEAFAKDPECIAFLADSKAQDKLNATLKLSEVKTSDYAAVFYPGGHGELSLFLETSCMFMQFN